jgi:hypothetical protein
MIHRGNEWLGRAETLIGSAGAKEPGKAHNCFIEQFGVLSFPCLKPLKVTHVFISCYGSFFIL